MKVNIRFNFDLDKEEDVYKYKEYQRYEQAYNVLYLFNSEFYQFCRQKLKYGTDLTDAEVKLLDDLKNLYYGLLSDHSLNLDD